MGQLILIMAENTETLNWITSSVGKFLRGCIFGALSVGQTPDHIAFIMDGNRRYSKKNNLKEGEGHKLGFTTLKCMLKYCYELDVKYITVYAVSIDNFKRSPAEVGALMELLKEKIESAMDKDSIVKQYGFRLHFAGDMKLLDDSLRWAVEKATTATAGNSKAVLTVCVAFTSTNEITNAVEEACGEKWEELRPMDDSCGSAYAGKGDMKEKNNISLTDIENHMYMKVAPSPDIVVRTSGESRLSNFLLWQTEHTILYCPSLLWPEIGLSPFSLGYPDIPTKAFLFREEKEVKCAKN